VPRVAEARVEQQREAGQHRKSGGEDDDVGVPGHRPASSRSVPHCRVTPGFIVVVVPTSISNRVPRIELRAPVCKLLNEPWLRCGVVSVANESGAAIQTGAGKRSSAKGGRLRYSDISDTLADRSTLGVQFPPSTPIKERAMARYVDGFVLPVPKKK